MNIKSLLRNLHIPAGFLIGFNLPILKPLTTANAVCIGIGLILVTISLILMYKNKL